MTNSVKYYLLKKQIGTEIQRLRIHLGLTQRDFGKQIGVSDAAISLWESASFTPKKDIIEHLQSLGASFTEEQMELITNNNSTSRLSWEERFDRIFTRKYIEDNAQGYDGDDWKFKDGEPIKPSVVKQFIKREMSEK